MDKEPVVNTPAVAETYPSVMPDLIAAMALKAATYDNELPFGARLGMGQEPQITA